jgi:hypothetical protein
MMTSRLGAISGFAAAGLAAIYVAGQLAEWAGWLGSAGGPESTSTALGVYVLLTPSLLLGPAFVVLAACVFAVADSERRAVAAAGLAFATGYAVLTGLVYFAQLTFVAPRLEQVDPVVIPFRFTPFASFLYSVDLLGYAWMSLSCGFVALALPPGEARVARAALFGTAAVLPFLVLQFAWRELIYVAALWALTFPAAATLLALWFARSGPKLR